MAKRFLSCLLALMLVASFAGCAKKETPSSQPSGEAPAASTAPAGPKQGGTLVVALPGNPSTFNPDAKPDDNAIFVFQNIFSKLVSLDNSYNVIPDLAKSWSVSEDGKVYTFQLHSGVKWHDGQPFSAEDVKWTLEAIVKNQGMASAALSVMERVEAPAPDRVVITLKAPNPGFLSSLGWFGTYIMPKHLYGTGGDWLSNPANEKPVGTGPFKFDSFKNDDHLTLVANQGYFNGAPYLEKVTYRILPDANTAVQAFLSKEIDTSLTRPPLSQVPVIKKSPGVKLDIYPMPNRYYLPMNLQRPAFAKPEVRQAIAHAVNRQEVLTKALKDIGQVAEGFYTPAIGWAYDGSLKVPAYDPQKAEQLLDAAGFPRGADGIRMKLVLPHFQGTEWGDIATVIKSNLRQVGIEVEIVQLEMAAWMDRVLTQKEFDLTLMGGQQGPDPDAMRGRFGTGGPLNMMSYSNPEFDQLLNQGGSTTDLQGRKEAYFKAQALLQKDLPFVPVAEMVSMALYWDAVRDLPHLADQQGKVPQWSFQQTWLDR